MPTEGQTQRDPKTSEPEVYKGGAWLTDWASLSAHAAWVSEDVHYNENEFTDRSAKALLVDDSGHLFRITNNSHLELLRVIAADGTTTDTVQPALTAFQLIPLNANGIYNVWRTGDNLTIVEQALGTPPESWLDTTDGVDAEVGNRYIVGLGHTVNFPPNPSHGSEIIAIPVNGDWSELSATFEGGAATIGNGQPLPLLARSDQATFVYQQGANNWLVATGGAVSPALYTKVNTFAEIPAPSTLLVGTQYLVINDGDPTRNGFWTAAGADLGATASTLVKG